MEKNDLLSDYEIGEVIGTGTFSIVKLAINKITKEKVAIKFYRKIKLFPNKNKISIQRELAILKELNHINIIKIHKINEDPNNYFVIMEYCEIGELYHYIIKKQKLSEDEASYFFYQIINGLNYIHHLKIVHRDLKPENLLLTKGNIIKIIDFGLSIHYTEGALLSTPCGSPSYASPEMVSGNEYDGIKTDIWSCGIVIFAMVCGYLPFEHENYIILFTNIVECDISYPEYLSDEVIDIMKKILIPDPNKRIGIKEIKEHPFYLRGKNIFGKMHKDLVDQIEMDNDNKNEKDNLNINNTNSELKILKNKSFKLFKEININDKNHEKKLFKNKRRQKKFGLEKYLSDKDKTNNISRFTVKLKKIISNNSHFQKKEEDDKIKLKMKIKENNSSKENKSISFKKIKRNILEKIEPNENMNSYSNYTNSRDIPISKDFTQNITKKNKFYSNIYNKVNSTLMHQLFKKENIEKYFKDKRLFMNSPKPNKYLNDENLSYISPGSKMKIILNLDEKIVKKHKIRNINHGNPKETKDYLSYLSNLSDNYQENKIKNVKKLSSIKLNKKTSYINDSSIYSRKNNGIKKLNLIKNKNLEKYENNDSNISSGCNIHHLKINDNNKDKNNITNIYNVKNINNIIICNEGLKYRINDLQHLTSNSNLPNIHSLTSRNDKNLLFKKILKTKNVFSKFKSNFILSNKINLKNEDYNSSNSYIRKELILSKVNKSINNEQKLNDKNQNSLNDNYKSNISSNQKKNYHETINKKQKSEKKINIGYLYDYLDFGKENKSFFKKNNRVYSLKKKNNLNNNINNYNIVNYPNIIKK